MKICQHGVLYRIKIQCEADTCAPRFTLDCRGAYGISKLYHTELDGNIYIFIYIHMCIHIHITWYIFYSYTYVCTCRLHCTGLYNGEQHVWLGELCYDFVLLRWHLRTKTQYWRYIYMAICCIFFTLAPRVEWHNNLWALNTSPPRNRSTFLPATRYRITLHSYGIMLCYIIS